MRKSSVVGATTTTGPRSRASNPFIEGGLDTPYIPGLVGDAEIYGPLDGVTAWSPDLASVISGAPPGAVGALYRMDVGPSGYNEDFGGFDVLLYINLGVRGPLMRASL